MTIPTDKRIAVLIPCYNEGLSIAKVVADFSVNLPNAEIYVFDNNSSDNTIAEAKKAGARVIKEKRQGKGFVVASMLSKIDADYYVMVDGDDTYPAEYVSALFEPVLNETADMAVGHRLSEYDEKAFRRFHIFGNKLVCRLINSVFGTHLVDPMSGYRVFTREVADNLPIVANGFDVETEMTLQLLYRKFVIKEIPIPYRSRPEGSVSKLRTFQDGFRVLVKILGIVRAYKPLTFFGGLGILSALLGLIIGSFVIFEYIQYQYIYSVPKAILSASLMVLGTLLAAIGLILNAMNFRLLEMMSVLTKQLEKSRIASLEKYRID